MSQSPDSSAPSGRQRLTRGILFLRIVLPLLVIAAGVAASLWLLNTGPEAKPRQRPKNAALVTVQTVEIGSRKVEIAVMGTVRPARQVQLTPQVGGEIVHLDKQFQPGGHFSVGEVLLRIDETDYRLALEQLHSEIARIAAELKLEQGKQRVALKEFELLGEQVAAEEEELMLREPQLATLQASLVAAKARLRQAELDLQRTAIAAPFNAVVLERHVDLGARVSSGSPLAVLAGTDSFWVEVAVPVSLLRWIKLPQEGTASEVGATIYDEAAWGEGRSRAGRVIRLLATLEESGRMARLLIEVDDPQVLQPRNADNPVLLLGSYVRAEIDGPTLTEVAAIGRDALRDGDRVWIMDPDNRLEIRPVEVVYRAERDVFVRGLSAGERLVVSSLPAPVAGMPLRLPGDQTLDGAGTR